MNRTRFLLGYKISSYSTPILISNGDLFIFPTGDNDQNYLFNVSPQTSKKSENEENEKLINILIIMKRKNIIFIYKVVYYIEE